MSVSSFDFIKDDHTRVLAKFQLGFANEASRASSLQFLYLYLQDLTNIEFPAEYVNWMQSCLKVLNTQHRQLGFSTLNQLLLRAYKHPHLNREVATSIIPKFLDNFLKNPTDAGFQCLEVSLFCYPGPCVQYKSTIEDLLFNRLKAGNELSVTVAHCIALLPVLGGGGVKSTPSTRWTDFYNKVVNTSSETFNKLFNIQTVFQNQETNRSETLSAIDLGEYKTEKEKITFLFYYFTNLLRVLKQMLLGKYPARISFSPSNQLNLITRGLFLNPKAIQHSGVAPNLPALHINLLESQDTLAMFCKNSLLPWGNLIERNLKHMLTVSNSRPNNHHLRIQIYTSIGNWLYAVQDGSSFDDFLDLFISSVLEDIKIRKTAVVLTGAKHNKGAQTKPTEEAVNGDIGFCSKRCNLALMTLNLFLKHHGIFQAKEKHAELQKSVIGILLELQRCDANHMPVPYNEVTCRKELYKCLLCLVIDHKNRGPSPLSYAISIYQNGLKDTSLSEICQDGLNTLEKFIHPGFHSAQFLPETEDDLRSIVDISFTQPVQLSVIEEVSESEVKETPEKGKKVTNDIVLVEKPPTAEIMAIDSDKNENSTEGTPNGTQILRLAKRPLEVEPSTPVNQVKLPRLATPAKEGKDTDKGKEKMKGGNKEHVTYTVSSSEDDLEIMEVENTKQTKESIKCPSYTPRNLVEKLTENEGGEVEDSVKTSPQMKDLALGKLLDSVDVNKGGSQPDDSIKKSPQKKDLALEKLTDSDDVNQGGSQREDSVKKSPQKKDLVLGTLPDPDNVKKGGSKPEDSVKTSPQKKDLALGKLPDPDDKGGTQAEDSVKTSPQKKDLALEKLPDSVDVSKRTFQPEDSIKKSPQKKDLVLEKLPDPDNVNKGRSQPEDSVKTSPQKKDLALEKLPDSDVKRGIQAEDSVKKSPQNKNLVVEKLPESKDGKLKSSQNEDEIKKSSETEGEELKSSQVEDDSSWECSSNASESSVLMDTPTKERRAKRIAEKRKYNLRSSCKLNRSVIEEETKPSDSDEDAIEVNEILNKIKNKLNEKI